MRRGEMVPGLAPLPLLAPRNDTTRGPGGVTRDTQGHPPLAAAGPRLAALPPGGRWGGVWPRRRGPGRRPSPRSEATYLTGDRPDPRSVRREARKAKGRGASDCSSEPGGAKRLGTRDRDRPHSHCTASGETFSSTSATAMLPPTTPGGTDRHQGQAASRASFPWPGLPAALHAPPRASARQVRPAVHENHRPQPGFCFTYHRGLAARAGN